MWPWLPQDDLILNSEDKNAIKTRHFLNLQLRWKHHSGTIVLFEGPQLHHNFPHPCSWETLSAAQMCSIGQRCLVTIFSGSKTDPGSRMSSKPTLWENGNAIHSPTREKRCDLIREPEQAHCRVQYYSFNAWTPDILESIKYPADMNHILGFQDIAEWRDHVLRWQLRAYSRAS